MLIPIKWLKEYVDIDMDTKLLADKLTMSGSHVDSIESVDKGIKNVVVGKILEISKHPDADKLVITKIDVGDEVIQIVTGAKNINEGDYIPVALSGAKLPGGVKIKKGKLRGVESNGMLCSANELGIEDSLIPKEHKDGIYILDNEYPLGKDIKDVMGLNGEVIDFEITPNRTDCLSVIGMARETAATLGTELKYPNIEIENEVDDINNYVKKIEVKDKDLCKRFYIKAVKDIKVKQSPMWMQRKLIEAGVRPINNVVDVTNYVMLEMGQPIHAYDLDNLNDNTIIVRRAVEDEKLTTLDGVERNLKSSMLVIADANKALGIAGVMGGQDSEVTSNTKTILVEAANFDGKSVRLTSRTLGLRTEASAKFEKDLDPNVVEKACVRVCQLLEQIGAGTVVKGYVDIYDEKVECKTIQLSMEKVSRLLGVDISQDRMIQILNSLELKSEIKDDKLVASIPTFRRDIELEADLIEEIGRIYGFDKIEAQPLVGTLTKGEKSTIRSIEDKAKSILSGIGLNEIMTYSFVSPKTYDKIALPDESVKRRYVKIMNPLGEDFSVMRTTLMANMMDVLTRNYKYGVERALAYEIGNTFIPREIPVKSLPYENKTLCIGMYGNSSFYEIKGVVEVLLDKLGIKGYDYVREEHHNTFHPGRTASIIKDNHVIGTIGEIHPIVLENYGMKERVYLAEMDFELIAFLSNLKRKYEPLPKYPSVTRDIALVVDRDIMVKEVEKVIWSNGKKLVSSVKLFDVYTGDQIDETKKSIAYSINYRSLERTLTDEEVSKVHNKIIEKLKDILNAELRS